MKIIYGFCLLLFSLIANAQWEKVYHSETEYIGMKDVTMTDENRGFAIGSDAASSGITGYILSTYDGFETFEVDSFPDYQMKSICFPSPEVGYAMGVLGAKLQVLKTIDSGENWMLINDSVAQINLNNMSIKFINETSGIIGTSAFLSKSSDGGETWLSPELSTNTGGKAFDLEDSIYVGADGAVMVYSYDYLESSEQVNIFSQASALETALKDSLFYVSALAQDGETDDFPYFNYAQLVVGNTYNLERNKLYFPYMRAIYDIEVVENSNLYGVCHPLPSIDQRHFKKSTDGGYTWYVQGTFTGSDVPYSRLDNLFCVNNTVCYVAFAGVIYRTTNGGGPLLEEVDQIAVSVKEIDDDLNFSIAPNPTTGQVTIRSEKEPIQKV